MRRSYPPFLAIIAIVSAFAIAGCGGGSDPRIERVFVAPPWTGDETYHYNLVDSGGDIYGTCELQTRVEAESGRTRLLRLCADGPNRDDGQALVDSETLKPFMAMRVISDAEKNKRTTFTATYGESTVHFKAEVNGKVNETERDLPEPDKTSPEPAYYDDESLLWLIRGMNLKQGFETAYKNVNAGNGRVFTVELKIEKAEKVKVPAGEFMAWKVRVRTDSITQYVWVTVDEPHTMVRARIERLTYELTDEG